MSSSLGAVSSCGHFNHLFESPLCESQTLLEKIASVVFHVLTAGIPLLIYQALNWCFAGVSEAQKPAVKHVEQVRVPEIIRGNDVDADLGFALQGTAEVFSIADKTPLEIQIKKCMNVVNRTCFLATAKIGGMEIDLGHVMLEWFRDREDKPFGSENTCYRLESYNSLYGYGAETRQKTNKILMTYLTSDLRQLYRGVGTALTQAAIEYSFIRGCEGRLLIDALWDSHGFYYKLGMRSTEKNFDQEIVQRLQARAKGPIPYEDCGSHYMYMPADARTEWKEKIRKKPIFPQVVQYLDKA